jgi:4-alpha-glucanotransferase
MDIAAHHRLGHIDETQHMEAVARRNEEVAALDAVLEGQDMTAFLARCASRLVAVQAETIFDVKDQLNLPGTVYEYPNWRGRLPVAIDQYEQDARLRAVAATMKEAGR